MSELASVYIAGQSLGWKREVDPGFGVLGLACLVPEVCSLSTSFLSLSSSYFPSAGGNNIKQIGERIGLLSG